MAQLMEDPVFLAFTTHATIVILKTVLMGPLTAYFRFSRGAFANQEDVARKPTEERKKLLRSHEDVERVKRCHQNDLENVVPFVLLGLLYSLSAPPPASALLLFRLFTCSRLLHSLAYLAPLPQPARGVCYLLGLLATGGMALHLLGGATLL
ncbi:LOW QUALITY PROTEIN: microsomal glutathione S-transferase 1-like [Menidia menidia]